MKRLGILLLVCLATSSALGWGNAGHQITARLAQDRLDDGTEARVRAILGQSWLSSIASLPDDFRNNDGARITAGWHFVNTPIDEASYDAARDCAGGQCVVEQIETMKRLLGDTSQSNSTRREALIYLVHFIGDLHQPFHNGSGIVNGQSDRGGNNIPVVFDGQDRNLHGVWDSGLISRRRLNVGDYVDHLADEVIPGLDVEAVSGGTSAEWSSESHALAQEFRVEPDTTLTDEYITRSAGIVDERLAKGALRLARALEEALPEP